MDKKTYMNKRIEYFSDVDSKKRCSFTITMLNDWYTLGHSDGECVEREITQYFRCDPRTHGFPLPSSSLPRIIEELQMRCTAANIPEAGQNGKAVKIDTDVYQFVPDKPFSGQRSHCFLSLDDMEPAGIDNPTILPMRAECMIPNDDLSGMNLLGAIGMAQPIDKDGDSYIP